MGQSLNRRLKMEEPNKDETAYESIYECGKCNKKFASMDELENHRETDHKVPERELVENTECHHLTTIPCFSGLDHMDVKTAAGWFEDECVLCGHKTKPYLIKYKLDQDPGSVM